MKLFQNNWIAMKDAFRNLFDELNIKKVVYVDNEFEIEVYKENLLSFLRNNINSTAIEWPFSVEVGIDYAISECKKWLNDINNKKEILDFIQKYSIARVEHNIESFFKDVFPEEFLVCLTPSKFAEEYIKDCVFEPSETNQLLILMDKYLEGNEEQDGVKLLSPFINQKYVACGIFSNTFSTEDELQHWKDCEDANNIFPLSKKRVFDEILFLEGLRNVVWLQQISEIKEHVIQLYKTAFNETENEIRSLDPASFDHAIIKSSVNEGCWEFEIMKRILLLLLDQRVEKLMIQEDAFVTFQYLTKQLKKITSCTVDGNQPNTKILESLYTSEIYADISYINRTFSQIANGDIFEIEGRGRYMLLCQACNLELRPEGVRKSKDFVYLLPILSGKTPRNSYSSTLQSSTTTTEYVDLGNSFKINPMILDLVSFDIEGRAILDTRKNADNLEHRQMLQSNLLLCYTSIYRTICQYWGLYNKVKTIHQGLLNQEDEELLLNLLKKALGITNIDLLNIEYDEATSIVDFHIKRVGRYKEPFAHIVLHDFSNYLSRHALPNNFSKR